MSGTVWPILLLSKGHSDIQDVTASDTGHLHVPEQCSPNKLPHAFPCVSHSLFWIWILSVCYVSFAEKFSKRMFRTFSFFFLSFSQISRALQWSSMSPDASLAASLAFFSYTTTSPRISTDLLWFSFSTVWGHFSWEVCLLNVIKHRASKCARSAHIVLDNGFSMLPGRPSSAVQFGGCTVLSHASTFGSAKEFSLFELSHRCCCCCEIACANSRTVALLATVCPPVCSRWPHHCSIMSIEKAIELWLPGHSGSLDGERTFYIPLCRPHIVFFFFVIHCLIWPWSIVVVYRLYSRLSISTLHINYVLYRSRCRMNRSAVMLLILQRVHYKLL